jgi:hypothetical protein
MAIDKKAYATSKVYTNQVALGIGSMRVEGTTVYFTILNTGEEVSVTLPTPKDGVSIENVVLNADNTITCEMSDGTTKTTDPLTISTTNIAYTTNKDSSIKNVKQALDKAMNISASTLNYTTIEDATVTNVKDALDLLFEEGGGVLEEEIKPNVTMGSVKTTYPVGTSLEEIIRDMLTEKIAPTVTVSLNPSTTLYDEVTGSISSLTINAIVTKKTNNIKKIEYYINNTVVKTNETGVATGGTFPYIYNATIDDDVTIKVVVTDIEGMTATATKTITFIGNSYYGLVDAETGEPNEALVKTLSKTLKNTKKYVYSGITTDWAKICYAYPAELGKLTSIMDKVNNFNYTSSFQLTTKTIDGISYYIYTLIDPTGADNVELTFE